MLSLESLWLEAKPGGGQVQGKSQAWFSKRNNSKKQYLLGVGSSHPATYLGISLLCVASKAPGIVSKILWSTLWSCCLCMCGELPPQINLSRSILRMCTKHPIFLHYVSLYNYNYIYIYIISSQLVYAFLSINATHQNLHEFMTSSPQLAVQEVQRRSKQFYLRPISVVRRPSRWSLLVWGVYPLPFLKPTVCTWKMAFGSSFLLFEMATLQGFGATLHFCFNNAEDTWICAVLVPKRTHSWNQ